MTTNVWLTSALTLVALLAIMRFRSLAAGYCAADGIYSRGMVSLWLSGWFKFTERVQRGEVPIAGRLFVIFAIGWLMSGSLLSRSAETTTIWQVGVSFMAGVVTLFARCSPTLMRGRSRFARSVSAVHLAAGIVTLTLLV